MRNHKADLILLEAVLLAGILLALVFVPSKKGDYVEVTVDGEFAGRFSLAKDIEIEIQGVDGGTDLLVIEKGQAYIKEASCPDKLCVNMGKISKNGQSIICLPNKVTVTVCSENSRSDIDGISGGVNEK